jgi:hypothetical protein
MTKPVNAQTLRYHDRRGLLASRDHHRRLPSSE